MIEVARAPRQASASTAITACWRGFTRVLWLALLAIVTPAQADPTLLGCPLGKVTLQAGIFLINTPCTLKGDVVLSGDATLVVLQTNLVIDGNVLLGDTARLIVSNARLSLDNHFVLEHRIESRGHAQIHFIDAALSTNLSSPGHSLASQYIAHDQAVMFVRNSGLQLPDSWLLVDLQDDAAVHAVNATFPSEIYPHDRATVILEGATTNARVWLEFLGGTTSVIDHLPNEKTPFDWSFGRNTPGMTNVGYQVEVLHAIPTVGVSSHPGSQLTLRNTEAQIAIGYFLVDLAAPQVLSGLGLFSHDVLLQHQARRFELSNANVFEFAWQIYTANPSVATPQPVVVDHSIVNEIAALERGQVAVNESLLQWAVVAAIGAGSRIEMASSTINSQSIIAAKDGFIHIDDSAVYGSLVEATDDAYILFSNARFEPNVCHALCLPACASLQNGGFEGDRCNPFNSAGGISEFRAKNRAVIAALGLRPVEAAVTIGTPLDLVGDLFVHVGPEIAHTYRYTLSYQQVGGASGGTIVADGRGPVRAGSLGVLQTTGLPAGNYTATLDLRRDGETIASTTRNFRLTTP